MQSAWLAWSRFYSGEASPELAPQIGAHNALSAGLLRNHSKILFGLVVLTLIPRLFMAWKIDILCPDAVLYIDIAESLGRGDFSAALVQMKLNIFPVILLLLHRVGLEWQAAGEIWNVFISTAAVLPLVGWVRRQFDHRIAYVAGFLYATHARLIERSPEVIRDPTFWFLFLVTVYLFWRATSENRLTHFLLGGIALWLAVLTRFEGAFLVVLLAGWSVIRLFTVRIDRWRLVAGVLLAIGFVPLLSAAVLAWCAPQTRSFDLVRTDPLVRARLWLDSWSATQPTPELQAVVIHDASGPAMVVEFAIKTGKGIELPAGILVLIGIIAARRSVFKITNLPIYLLIVLLMGASWIHLWYSGVISSRYLITVFFLTAPWSATGMIWIASQFARVRLPAVAEHRVFATASLFLLVALIGWSDALSSPFQARRELAAIGKWIETHYGEGALVQIVPDRAALINYYARTHCVELANLDPAEYVTLLRQSPSPVIVLDAKRADLESWLAPDFQRLAPLPGFSSPAGSKPHKLQVIVLVRQPFPTTRFVATKKQNPGRGL